MQATQVIFLAFLAVSAFINTEARTLDVRNEKSINNEFVIYKQIIEKDVHIYEENLKEIVEDAIKNIRGELVKALEEISNTVNGITKVPELLQSKDNNITDCIAEVFPELKALVQTTQETQTACVQENLEPIIAIKNDLETYLKKQRGKVEEIIAAMQGCTDWDCHEENGTKLIELLGEIRDRVREAVQEAVEVIQSSLPSAVKCIEDASDNFYVEIKEIHGELVACIRA